MVRICTEIRSTCKVNYHLLIPLKLIPPMKVRDKGVSGSFQLIKGFSREFFDRDG